MGLERVTALNNMLSRGSTSYKVAKIIQDEWGLFRDISYKALVNQIARYWADVSIKAIDPEGASGNALVTLTADPRVRQDVLIKMQELAGIQLTRIKSLVVKETSMPMPVTSVSNAINKEVETLSKMYQDIQRTQFDLGVDEFRGILVQGGKVIETRTTDPDGTVHETRALEAYQTAMNALNSLPPPLDMGEAEEVSAQLIVQDAG